MHPEKGKAMTPPTKVFDLTKVAALLAERALEYSTAESNPFKDGEMSLTPEAWVMALEACLKIARRKSAEDKEDELWPLVSHGVIDVGAIAMLGVYHLIGDLEEASIGSPTTEEA